MVSGGAKVERVEDELIEGLICAATEKSSP